jgi:hypothetical protein
MNKLKINHDKFPIILFSSPRTGSTILGHYFASTYNLTYFNEPDENNNTNENFKSFLHDKRIDYVLKFHARKISFYKNFNIFYNSSKISIQRKNLVDQIASSYLARKRNVWSYGRSSNQLSLEFPVEINLKEIYKAISIITASNDAVKNLRINFDANLFYEDIDWNKLNYDEYSIVTPKPSNYDDIKMTILECLASTNK